MLESTNTIIRGPTRSPRAPDPYRRWARRGARDHRAGRRGGRLSVRARWRAGPTPPSTSGAAAPPCGRGDPAPRESTPGVDDSYTHVTILIVSPATCPPADA